MQADKIAPVMVVVIAFVFAVRNAILQGKSHYLFTREWQQWPHHHASFFCDISHPCTSLTPDEVQQQCLGHVARMVCSKHVVEFIPFHNLRKPLVPEITGSHLYAYLMLGSIFSCVKFHG